MPSVRPCPVVLAVLAAGLGVVPAAAAQDAGRGDGARVDRDSSVVWSPAPGVVVVAPDSSALAALAVPPPAPERRGRLVATGVASYYGERFRGRRTASGQRFDPDALTAAHRTLPFGTRLRVTHVRSGRSVVVRVNDRGPHARGRVIDLSRAAARRLGIVRAGTGRVRVERL